MNKYIIAFCLLASGNILHSMSFLQKITVAAERDGARINDHFTQNYPHATLEQKHKAIDNYMFEMIKDSQIDITKKVLNDSIKPVSKYIAGGLIAGYSVWACFKIKELYYRQQYLQKAQVEFEKKKNFKLKQDRGISEIMLRKNLPEDTGYLAKEFNQPKQDINDEYDEKIRNYPLEQMSDIPYFQMWQTQGNYVSSKLLTFSKYYAVTAVSALALGTVVNAGLYMYITPIVKKQIKS